MKYDNDIERLTDYLEGTGQDNDSLPASVNRKAWDELQDIDEAVNRTMGNIPDENEAWNKFAEAHFDKSEVRSRHILIMKWVAAVAAVILLIIGIGIYNRGKNLKEKDSMSMKKAIDKPSAERLISKVSQAEETEPTKMLTVKTGSEETHRLTLPDGTIVWLNVKSRITYPTRFNGNDRRVNLKGEAYFNVRHDEAHPFIIRANGMSTKVLGTEFNVRCYDRADFHVTLISGMVEVCTIGDTVRIHPSEDAHLNENGSFDVKHVNVKAFTCWREGIVYFDNATLREILEQMGEWYNLNIICSDKSILYHHFHYMYNRNAPIEEALKLLNSSSDIDAKIVNGTIIIN